MKKIKFQNNYYNRLNKSKQTYYVNNLLQKINFQGRLLRLMINYLFQMDSLKTLVNCNKNWINLMKSINKSNNKICNLNYKKMNLEI